MTTAFDISDRYTDAWADLDPISATTVGVGGRDHLGTDYSPDGHARRADLNRNTKKELLALGSSDQVQAFAAKVLVADLDEKLNRYESNKHRRDLNHIYSPFQQARDVFEMMPRASVEDWDSIRSRLLTFGEMLRGYQMSLQEGVSAGDTAAVRQAESVLEQAKIAASDQSMFVEFVSEASSLGIEPSLVEEAVGSARAACGDFATWLESDYLPAARPEDAVGEQRYVVGAEEFLGMRLDPHETYDWGWEEVARIRREMSETAATIDPALSLEEVIDLLKTDPARSAATREEFTEFVSNLQQQAIVQLSGKHFDVPDELKVVTVNIAPPGVPLGAWYNAPSEDFSRPGAIWYAPGERERLPYWQEVSTAYHEGFPGHHLQVGTAMLNRDRLSRFQRVGIWKSGSGEGWALYAERLMDELDFFEKPEYRLGLLTSQLFRSIRVVVDIGCQLAKPIPATAPLFGGETWDYDKGVDYMTIVGLQPRDVSESEVTRYLGWWGQAISYKVGEREILKMRDVSRKNKREDFDLKEFHGKLLAAGAIRLDLLWDEVT